MSMAIKVVPYQVAWEQVYRREKTIGGKAW